MAYAGVAAVKNSVARGVITYPFDFAQGRLFRQEREGVGRLGWVREIRRVGHRHCLLLKAARRDLSLKD